MRVTVGRARPSGLPPWRRLVVLAVVPAVVLVTAGVLAWIRFDGGGPQYRRGPVTVFTGGTGGIYYRYGTALSASINGSLPGVRATTMITGAAVDNLRRVAAEPNTFGFSTMDAATAAVRGQDPFKKAALPVRAVARIYDEYIHLVVPRDSPVRTLADLRGRRVSTGAPGSGTDLVATRLFTVDPAIDLADVTQRRLGVDESAKALADGTIDAFFWQGGLPTITVADLASRFPVWFVPLDGLVGRLDDVQEWGAEYRRGVIPDGAYAGVGATPTVAMADLLVTSVDTDPGLVREVTRILFDARETIARVVPVAYSLDPRSAVATGPVPLHEGAARYYRATKV
ncbi:TAXI family TRAP transporter solute-binding subunit [Pseudofrankia sp. BMG5.37]|uniref:TAXI family TRAP transporter solute-binding subunit n=1 Tax=Pseudofrankia sp. BMG5.37 TaxID=3050035 RepID=UPI002894F7F6|nr:TAXI family TRAP transporter solute-binding subunit [Pseudofrankia sp. BMG5.37]MDT3440620.1 TAXI family TRAP transporter solute-binding subunit [Pseudofrankia sp. BMG5.37]